MNASKKWCERLINNNLIITYICAHGTSIMKSYTMKLAYWSLYWNQDISTFGTKILARYTGMYYGKKPSFMRGTSRALAKLQYKAKRKKITAT